MIHLYVSKTKENRNLGRKTGVERHLLRLASRGQQSPSDIQTHPLPSCREATVPSSCP